VLAFLEPLAAARAADLEGSFRGGAFAVSANAKVGPIDVVLGRAASQSCPCEGTNGKVRTNVVEGLSAGPGGDVATLGVMRATAFADKTASAAVVRTSARVADVDLLDGMIRADAVRAVAEVEASSSRIERSAGASEFANLRVLGNIVSADVEPNSRIRLPGVGSVILKHVKPYGNAREGGLTVEMIVVRVSEANRFGLPIGSEIVVGRARAGFDRDPVEVVVGGTAYLTQANAEVGENLQNRIGRAALVHIGCEGTKGEVRKRNIAGLDVGRILTIGAGTTTAFGGPTGTGTVARATAEVEGVRLLGGLVRIGAVRAVATDRLRSGVRTSSADGTRIIDLRIAGIRVGDVTDRNIKLAVPLVGYVVLNEVVRPPPGTKQHLKVNGVRLVVDALGGLLDVGSEIVIAHADSTAYR
jgi:hypothetical protein